MSFIESIKSIFIKEAEVAHETKAIVGVDSIGRTNPISYTLLNDSVARHLGRNDAQLSSTFYTIVNSIQTTSLSIPWNVYRLKNDENAEKVPNHPLGELLYRPNPKQSWSEFVMQYLGYFLSDGNVFIYLIVNETGLNRGQPKQLWIMPRNTEIVAGSGWMADVRGYRIPLATGGYQDFKPEQVLHIKKFNLSDSLYGQSPIQAGLLTLTSLDYATKQRIQQLANGGPRTVFFNDSATGTSEEEGLTETQEQDLVRKINRPGKLTFLNNKVGTAQIGLSPVDLDLLNAMQADEGRVADLLNYPSILLSGTKSSTYNNVSEANKALYNNCLIPYLKPLRDGLNFKLGAAYKDKVYIDMDLSTIEVLKPNLKDLIAAVATADFLTINEKRTATGFPAIDGGDGFLRSAAINYLASVDEEPATPEVPAYDDQDDEVEGE